jgi:hypothetical protein
MTDEKKNKLKKHQKKFMEIEIKRPEKCHLWKIDDFKSGDLNNREAFNVLHTYTESSHLWRYLMECKDCGQLYFFEFYEEIDWENGNDPQYCTYIPVESAEDAGKLSGISQLGLLKFKPRIQSDWPANKPEKKVYWVR